MNDAYTVGITLSLDDEVSSGIAAIRGDLEGLNQALGESLAELADLRRAAGPALSTLAQATAAVRPAKTVKTPAAASEAPSSPQPAAITAAAESLPAMREIMRPAPAQPDHPFAPPAPPTSESSSGSKQSSRIEILPLTSGAMPPRLDAHQGAAIAPPALRAIPAPASPPPAGLALDDLLGLTRTMIPTAPVAEAPDGEAEHAPEGARAFIFATPVAPLETGAEPEPAPPARARPAPQSFRAPGAAAPLSPLFDARPPAAPRGPAAAAGGDNGAIRGDVFLDGARVGHWMGEHMAASAARPPSGYSGVDPRLGPLWPGAPVVP